MFLIGSFTIKNIYVYDIYIYINHWKNRIASGNSEIGAHVRSDPGYLICLNHLLASKVVPDLICFIQKNVRTVF